MARRSANTAENVIPTRRNGKLNSQTIGHKTTTSRASGQHRTRSRHQAIVAISVFTMRLLRPVSGAGRIADCQALRPLACDEPANAVDKSAECGDELPVAYARVIAKAATRAEAPDRNIKH